MELCAQLDVLDEDFLDVCSPLSNILVDLLLDIVGDLLSFLEQVLEDKLAAGILEDGIGDL